MKYSIGAGGWPVGQFLIPAGTIIDASDDSGNDDWVRLAKGQVPPMNSHALDQEAYDAMYAAYPGHRHLLMSGPNVNTRR